MRGDDSTSQRKSSMFIECRRRNVCCVGERSRGVELIDRPFEVYCLLKGGVLEVSCKHHVAKLAYAQFLYN